ncbi:MAG: gamma-glutamyltransferase [Bacteroidota bacterium]
MENPTVWRLSFLLSILSLFLLISSCRPSKSDPLFQIDKQAIADKAMVVSAHPLATKAGLEVMQQGGNAADAAIAVQFALAVTYPVAGNIGGGGFMIWRDQQGQTAALDFREKAPLAAHRDMYLDSLGNVIKGLSINGHLAAGVPGSVDGMFKIFDRYSQLKDFPKLINPAIRLAADGFPVTEQQAKRLNRFEEGFRKYNSTLPVFVKEGGWKAGDLLQQPDLARTLERIRDKGEAGFYEGEVADKIVAEMKAGGGIMTLEDLKKYDAVWRAPVQSQYKGFEIISMPPPSSGGIALTQLLEIAEEYPLRDWGFHSLQAVHLMTEAERRVYADRATHLGDADFYPVPQAQLLDPAYLLTRMEDYTPTQATPSDSILAGNFVPQESEETTHFSIVDAAGNAVSITTTINSGYGSKTNVTGAGFILNNEMDDFSAKPGIPNFYGLIGAEANAIRPEKRMLSSMTPTIVAKDGQLYMVVGTPGGSTIITSVFQCILNVVEFGMDMSASVAAPRFHHQWKPDALQYEAETFSPALLDSLQAKGHALKERGSIGRVDAILVQPDGKLEGGADPRGDDHAEGF